MSWIHIIGGGVSGLSLGMSLAERGELPGEVVISDPKLYQDRSQTFCFWFTDDDRELLNLKVLVFLVLFDHEIQGRCP